ncbi:MAG: LysM peptidoglycan-binding domain-containing protein [Chloroflexota bacterium]|nr:LysM peptidoglycan-binding domain-containing protein [Chloroflexota bacterium]
MFIQVRFQLTMWLLVALLSGVPQVSYAHSSPEQRGSALALTAKPVPPDQGSILYIVKAGDTLASIACAFHVKVTTLIALNKLQTNQVYGGQILRIPPATTVVTC